MILPLNSIMSTISLAQLLSTCMDASYQGCEIIREFQKKGIIKGTLKEGDEIKSVVTQADIDAQSKIIKCLRDTWDNDGDTLRIIGEEDDDMEQQDVGSTTATPLRKDLLNGESNIMIDYKDDDQIKLEEISIFIDPLDGTREFVEGRLENVACLIGIAKNNRAIAGVIALPFPNGSVRGSSGDDNETDIVVHYAIGDKSISGTWPTRKSGEVMKPSEHDNGATIFTGDSNNSVLVNATKCAMSLAQNPRHDIIGGTAAKLLRVATEPNSLAILHFKTELWDTCSAEALLTTKGGKITDLFGAKLVYEPNNRPFGNIFGVVASSAELSDLHDKVCSSMRSDCQSVHAVFKKWLGATPPSSPQAIDLARDLDGIPLSVSYIQSLFSSTNNNNSLKGYSIPESEAWRGMMSTGGRLHLDWQQDDPNLPSSVFYKRIVMADLTHARSKLMTAPHKLTRDVKSYQVETSFLTSKACQHLRQKTQLRINRVFGSDLRPATSKIPKEQLESRFSLVLEDFDQNLWAHQWLLDLEGTKAALDTFAKMHAYFWNGSHFWGLDGGVPGDELKRDVWPNGGYMSPALQGLDQLKQVNEGWKNRYPTFQKHLTDIDDLELLGKKLEEIAFVIGEKAHPFSSSNEKVMKESQKYKTFIHGDPKQANIFFKRDTTTKDNNNLEVGLIDFQWCGFGLAGTDIAHHITAAVHASCLSHDGEKEKKLLDYYHSCLSKYLVQYGVAQSEAEVEEQYFPRCVLQEQYEIALLDVCRMVFAYAWQRWKEETEPTPASLNRNAYNKSLPNVLWLITRCHFLLEKYKGKFTH